MSTTMRSCSRTACPRTAVATLTYNYADSTAVLGPLSTYAEPHSYDLCAQHAERLTAPKGWEVVRLISDFSELPDPTDDLTAVADAVRSASDPQAAVRKESAERLRRSGQGHFPERLDPLPVRRDVAAGGGTSDAGVPRVARLRVLRDGYSAGDEG